MRNRSGGGVPLESLSDAIVFTVGSGSYGLADIVGAARAWGDFARLEEAVRAGIACLSHATAEDSLPDDAEVEAAAAEFRYARDLVTADEMEAWLDRWALPLEEWTAYLQRRLLRQRWADDVGDLLVQHPVRAAEIAEAVHAEGICSGEYGRVALKLAARLAVWEHARTEGWHASADEPEVAVLDAVVEQLRARVVTPATLRAEIASHHVGWVRVDGELLAFPELARAREAALCVREDGRALAEVGADARTVVRPGRFYLEDVEPAWRDALLAAQSGDLVGPLPGPSGFVVFLVTRKTLPVEDDPAVRGRAAAALLDRALEHELSHRVKWHQRL